MTQRNFRRLWGFQLSVSDPIQKMFLLLLILSLGMQLHQTTGKNGQREGPEKEEQVMAPSWSQWFQCGPEAEGFLWGEVWLLAVTSTAKRRVACACPCSCFIKTETENIVTSSMEVVTRSQNHSDHAPLNWHKRALVVCPEKWDAKQLSPSLLAGTMRRQRSGGHLEDPVTLKSLLQTFRWLLNIHCSSSFKKQQ